MNYSGFMISALALAIVGCNSSSSVSSTPGTNDGLEVEQKAITRAGCAFDNKNRCTHLIENRSLFASFFQPEGLGERDENKKAKGQRVTTKFVAEAAAEIRQCFPVSGDSVVIINNMKLAGKLFSVRGTSPLSEQTSTCFLSPITEGS